MDFMAGRQTPEEKARRGRGFATAQAQHDGRRRDSADRGDRMPQIQDAFDITTQLVSGTQTTTGDRGLYGAIDGRTPTVLPESLNAQAKLERLSNIYTCSLAAS